MRDVKEISENDDVTIMDLGNDGGICKVHHKGEQLCVIFSNGLGWDHVSVSLSSECPNWEEMVFIKDIFFEDDEVVLQYHPGKKEYINVHPYCLHLWRKQGVPVELPPSYMLA